MTPSRLWPLAVLLLSLPAAAEPQAQACVEVRIGGERVFDWQCLNARLAGQVESERNRQAQAAAALVASQPSGPTELNLFDEAATAQRLGASFGHSVIPERPVEIFRTPLEIKH